MGILTFSFEMTLILALFSEDPADLKTPFVESCQPEQKRDYISAVDQVWPKNYVHFRSFVLEVFDPILEIISINTCACFEDSYARIESPVTYINLWDMLQHLHSGDTDAVRIIMQPLYDSSESDQAEFHRQTQAGSVELLQCVARRVPQGTYLGYLAAVKIGFIRY